MKKTLIMLLMLALLTVSYAGAATLENVPEWLEGTLCISAVGSKENENEEEVNSYAIGKAADSAWEKYLRYVIFYDFSEGKIETAEIPYGSELSMDLREGGQPILLLQADNGYFAGDGVEESDKREYYLATLVNDPGNEWHRRFYYGSIEDYAFREWPLPADWVVGVDAGDYWAKIKIDNILEPVAIMGPRFCVYYFGYGVSDAGGLEIQMIRRTDAGDTVLAHFDLADNLHMMEYAISPGGLFAWEDIAGVTENRRDTGRIIVSDGCTEMVLAEEGKSFYNPCWLNDFELVYFEVRSDYQTDWTVRLCKWNRETGETEYMTAADGSEMALRTEERTSIEVEEVLLADEKYLVVLYHIDWWGAVRDEFVTVFSLEDGAQYTFDPMPDSGAVYYKSHRLIAEDGALLSFDWYNASPKLAWSTPFDAAEWEEW